MKLQLFGAIALLAPAAASAQSITSEQVLQRIETLERENAELKAEVSRLARQVPQSVQPPAVPAPPPAPEALSSVASPQPQAMPPNGPSWQGAYLGAHIGGARTRYRIEDPQGGALSGSGVTYGGQLGWRQQSGRLVTGVELDLSRSRGQSATFPFSAQFRTTATGRVKGLIGLTAGPALFYGTGGLQVSEVHILDQPNARGIDASGFVYGLGVGVRVAPPWSVAIEALDADLGLIPNVGAVSNRGQELTLRLNRRLP